MATKNFLLKVLSLSIFIFGLVACETFNKRSEPLDEPVDTIEQPQESSSNGKKPEFLQKASPRLGIILGPGGALSFAHVGFLQELEKQKIPVHAIAGIEWGALVAATYSQEAKGHGVEWKLLKLPVDKFANKSFFSRGESAPKVSQFNEYLNSVFAGARTNAGAIPFACPYINRKKEVLKVQTQGYSKNAVKVCWPSEPHFELGAVSANRLAISELSRFLRSKGAEVVLYVDVLSLNKGLSKKAKNKPSAFQALESKSLVKLLSKPEVDEVIRIPLSGFRIDSYKSLRSIIRNGQLKTKTPLKGMAKKYAY